MLLEGRLALVTRAAQGIGAGIARVQAGNGARVSIIDIQAEQASKFARDIGGCAVDADLTTKEGCQKAVQETVATLGGLDIIVNNAAPARNRELIGDIEGSDWEVHAALVLQAVTHLIDAARPHMKPGASVINISSVTAHSVMPDHCSWPYHVSKAGLNQLTRYLACMLGPDGVRVNAVAPALVDRDEGRKLSDDPEMARIIGATVPLGRAGSARDIGNAVAFLCSDAASYITGQVLIVDGGLGVREVFAAGVSASQSN